MEEPTQAVLVLPSLGMSLISASPCLPPTEKNKQALLCSYSHSLASIGLMLSLPQLSVATVLPAALSPAVVGKILAFEDAQF